MDKALRVLLLCSLLWSACSAEDGMDALDGRSFLLDSAEGFAARPGTEVRLTFEGNQLSFYAGCNSHAGRYYVGRDRLIVDDVSSTQIGCEPALAAQDDALVRFLTLRPLFALRGSRLTLRGREARLVFLDRTIADPDRPLVGPVWTIDTLLSGDAASSFDGMATLVFAKDGSLEVETSCGVGGGRYAVSGDRITLTEVSYAEESCSASDEAIRAILGDGALQGDIEAARLTLTRGDAGLSATTE